MDAAPPRSAQQRKDDTLARLAADIDAWVSTASPDGEPYLVPLSYVWDGTALTMATPQASPTGRNLAASGRARLALGPTRDVVLIEAAVETFSRDQVPEPMAEAFAARLWDARLSKPVYAYFRITPVSVQAWREENELAGRWLMRDGAWLV
jgi:hypothetical protein